MTSKKYLGSIFSQDKSRNYGIKFLMTAVVKYNSRMKNYSIMYSVIMVCMQNYIGTKIDKLFCFCLNVLLNILLSIYIDFENMKDVIVFLEGNTYFSNCKENERFKKVNKS